MIDRLVYDSFEPVTTLAAAAAVTERVTLVTSVLLGPLRTNHALLASQLATLDRLAAGRLLLGLAPGVRDDDFTASGVDYHHRGRALDSLVATLRATWQEGSPVGPAPAQAVGPGMVFGGMSAATFRRVAAHGQGWISGVTGVEGFTTGAHAARQAWKVAGRAGGPRLLACASYALGATAVRDLEANLRDYYRFLPWLAEQAVTSAATTGDQLLEIAAVYAAAGCHDLIFFPGRADLDQIDALADTLPLPPP